MAPRVPRQGGPLSGEALAVQEAVRSYLEGEAGISAKLGRVTEVKTADYQAKAGEIVLCDTSAGAFSVYLPKTSRAQLGQYVGVVAFGSSSGAVLVNALTVRPADGDATIEDRSTLVMSTVNMLREFVALKTTRWWLR